jgi:hypothetical protein
MSNRTPQELRADEAISTYNDGVADERAAAVAWIRSIANSPNTPWLSNDRREGYRAIADCIEKELHLGI